jgi:hypothetical protein
MLVGSSTTKLVPKEEKSREIGLISQMAITSSWRYFN